MTLYEFLLFIHVTASIVWIGAGFLSLVLATTYDRESDEAAITRFLHDQEWLAMRLFVPASLIVVVFGIAMVIESDAWTFEYLWIVLGLVGYAATFVTGFFLIRPASERIGGDEAAGRAADARAAGEDPQADRDGARGLRDVRARGAGHGGEATGDDSGVLIAMALILAAGVGYILVSLRAIDARSPQPTSA
jgi:hypothetical protein